MSFIKKFKNVICSVLMVTTYAMTVESLMVQTAMAAPVCSAYGANGSTPSCMTIKAGSNVVAAPRLQWNLVSQDVTSSTQKLLGATTGLDRNDTSGNTSASLLDIKPNQVAAAIGTFPANVPLVVGRYEPMSSTLHIDIFKLERTMVNGQPTSALYQASFGPGYGEYWKAMGTYLSPDERKTGNSVGPNPFSQFGSLSADSFSNITLKGAMVALGHAQRYAGAPISLLVNYVPKTEQYTKKSGGVFRKKITSYVDYYAKPEYYLGTPTTLQGGMVATYCANDPSSESCYGYQVASSGVGFMKMEGGNILDNREFVHQWSQSKSGFTLLAVFVIAFVFAFALAAIAPALSAMAPSAGATAGAGAGNVMAGFWTNVLSMAGTEIGGATALSAAAIEAGIYTTVTAAVGSGFGGVYGAGGVAFSQEKALTVPQDLGHVSAYQYRDKMLSNGSVTGGIDSTLTPVRKQLTGDCGSGTLLKNCGGASGIVPRADEYSTFDNVEFIRDNGKPTRAPTQ